VISGDIASKQETSDHEARFFSSRRIACCFVDHSTGEPPDKLPLDHRVEGKPSDWDGSARGSDKHGDVAEEQ
jgi:hypothetical protein